MKSDKDPATMTLAQIEEELLFCTDTVESIQCQLSRSTVLGCDNRPMPTAEYHEWRDRARNALMKHNARRRELSYWEKKHRERNVKMQAAEFMCLPLDSMPEILYAALVLLRRWSKDRADVTAEEWSVLDMLQAEASNAPMVATDGK